MSGRKRLLMIEMKYIYCRESSMLSEITDGQESGILSEINFL